MCALLVYEMRPLDPEAPMVLEAQWDRPNVPFREQVTACIGHPQSNEKIMEEKSERGENSTVLHMRNFLAGCRSRDHQKLNADIEIGNAKRKVINGFVESEMNAQK